MSGILSIMIPIILLLGCGWICRERKIIEKNEIKGMKTISIKFLWPLVLFYAFFTSDYGVEAILYASVIFLSNLTGFGLGFVLRKKIKNHGFSYPYLLSGFETGMIGYPLYMLLFGSDKISYLALLDIGHALFIFPIYLSCLNKEQSQGNGKEVLKDMIKSPIIIALFVGIISGVSGFSRIVMDSGAGSVIDKLYSLISSANIVMILIVMGYNITFSINQIIDSMKVIVIRIFFMTCSALLCVYAISRFVPLDKYLLCAIIVTFIMPPVYMLTVYVKNEEENEFISTTSSVYTIITIISFFVMTIVIR